MQIEHDGVTLHVAEDGNPSGPVVTFLHGITSCTDTWDWAVPDLVAEYRVLRLDFRGHGDSGRAPGTYSFANCVGDAVAALEQVAGGPTVLVGHSLGGGTAAALAQQRPDLVTAVLLEDPAIMTTTLEGAADGEPNALMGVFAMMRQTIPMLQDSGITADGLVGMLNESPGLDGKPFKESMHPDAIQAMAAGMLRLDASVLDPVLEGRMEAVFDPHATIPVPGIVLAGDEADPSTIVRGSEKALLAEHSPQIDVRVVTGAGHMIHDSLAYREVVRTALRELLAGL